MNKRKIFTLALTICMIAILAIGGSLAYLTDADSKKNVFTYGNVTIDLWENFENESKLLPATGSAQEGTLKNGVEKEVFVTNTGTEDAYVRVHIAIPKILDDGADTFLAVNNVLHFNYAEESIGKDKWDWSNSTGAPYEGEWNYYETKIEGIDYNVYVVTYEKVLAKDKTTEDAMHQVYLDSKVTNKMLDDISKTLGDKWNIYVVAEGAQADGFANAYEALNTAFGVPGTYTMNWGVNTKNTAEDREME